ncbi:transposase IS4 family protein [Methylobacterium aquaticum]|uniref:Transposase IS4 family protein n=1 Tax=Methylobacterium aquaticum TaxID=270351 RepID=A0A1Y0Z8L9_9HYPH|nr:transposase IS4 family protein [Methylobacterium aquaticum]
MLAPLLPAPARTGRSWLWSQRAVLDGILYVLRTGCAWRDLPRLPPGAPCTAGSCAGPKQACSSGWLMP